jgi:transcriptional regulator with XRE-family HTH domain
MAAEAKIDDDRMLEMLKKGLSQAAVARHFGVSRQAVNRRLKVMRRQANPDASVLAGNEEELVDKVVCEFCEMESPKDDVDEDGMCRLCRWAYGKGEYATKC